MSRSGEPEFTLRAVATGMVLGALLAPCNVYAGLKIGWAFNMSVAAALLGYGFWGGLERGAGTPNWSIKESNINQTAASSGAAIAGAGLVAPIPALTLLTGTELSLGPLSLWVWTVSLLGVLVAVAVRHRLLEQDALPFPTGVATAETLRELYGRGREAALRMRSLVAAGVASASLKLLSVPKLFLPGQIGSLSLTQLGWGFDPSMMLVGFGAIIGLRSGASVLLGSLLAWGVLGPIVHARGWIPGAPPAGAPWFGRMVEWLLWPGVGLMVSASLTSFAMGWFVRRSLRQTAVPESEKSRRIGWSNWLWAMAAMTLLGTAVQKLLFDIPIAIGILGVLFAFALAVVAGRVAGETGITPIGAMGKVSQLGFAAAAPANVTVNLMAANMAGGAASQCADMLHDLKTGLLVGASPRKQAFAQLFGVTAGSLAGAYTYLILIPDPASSLMTETWPAPAVATWKAVAEVFRDGWDQVPTGAMTATMGGILAGAAMAVAEATLPRRLGRWVPQPSALGLAFVLPAWNGVSMFAGALLATLTGRRFPGWRDRVVVIAAGLVAGESLAGVGKAFWSIITS